jgi:hypothetical protein
MSSMILTGPPTGCGQTWRRIAGGKFQLSDARRTPDQLLRSETDGRAHLLGTLFDTLLGHYKTT